MRLNSSEPYYNTTGDSTRHNKKGELLIGIFSTHCFNETYTHCGQTRTLSRILHPDGKFPIFSYKKNLTTATIITPSTNIIVRGLSIRSPGAHLLTVALIVDGAQGVVIDGVSIDAIMAGIGVSSSHLVQVQSCRFNRVNHVWLGYSLMVGCFTVGVSMTNCIGDKVSMNTGLTQSLLI